MLELFRGADQREAPALVGKRFADGSAVRRDGAHGLVEHLPPAETVEFLLGYDGVGACGKLDRAVLVMHDRHARLGRAKKH